MSKIYSSGGRQLTSANKFAIYADAEVPLPIIDLHKESKRSGSLHTAGDGTMSIGLNGLGDQGGESGQQQIPLDVSQWLPFAAPKYKISPDIKDYIVVPVIAIPSDLPNRNRIAFPLKELLAFNTEMGCQAYKSWVGKPTYSEHKNDVVEEAYGVIADTSMVKLNGWVGGKVWKLLMLALFDRSKNVERVADIAQGNVNSYSMGAWVSSYQCSVCNAEVGRCSHVELRDNRSTLTEANGRLAFKNCSGIVGFELSVVNTPAWVTAISDKVGDLG
jgi:hypothetical protein